MPFFTIPPKVLVAKNLVGSILGCDKGITGLKGFRGREDDVVTVHTNGGNNALSFRGGGGVVGFPQDFGLGNGANGLGGVTFHGLELEITGLGYNIAVGRTVLAQVGNGRGLGLVNVD